MSELQYQSKPETRDSRSQRLLRGLFIALGPISLVAYVLVHTWLNLTGACYNLVIESSLSPLLRRPIRLSNAAVYALSPLIVLVAPLAGIVHASIGLAKALVAGAVRLGHWQTGIAAKPLAGVLGAAWFLLAVWILVACVRPEAGWRLIGRDMPGVGEYKSASSRQMILGELPDSMQQRRRFLLSADPQAQQDLQRMARSILEQRRFLLPPDSPELAQDSEQLVPLAMADLAGDLQDDRFPLILFPPDVQRYLAGLPWYYQLPRETTDGQSRTYVLLGCLALAGLLMTRWPGMGVLARGGVVGIGQYAVRTGVALAVVIAAFAGRGPQMELKAQQAAQVLVLLMAAALVWWLAWKASQYWRLPRQYSPFLAMRLLQRKRIAFFSLGAVTLCVAMVLIVISVMGGFLDMVRERSHRLAGDLIVAGDPVIGFPHYQKFIDQIRAWPQIEAATPVIKSFGLVQMLADGSTKPVHIVGLRLDEVNAVTGFRDNLFYEQWYPGSTNLKPQRQPLFGLDGEGRPVLPAELDKALYASKAWQELQQDPEEKHRYDRTPSRLSYDAPFPGPGVFAFNSNESDSGEGMARRPGWGARQLPGIILGRDIVAERTASGEYYRPPRYPRGTQVLLQVLPLSREGRAVSGIGPERAIFHYADDSRTGVYEIDSMFAYVDFDLLQDMLNMGQVKRASPPSQPGSAGDAGGSGRSEFLEARASEIQIRLKPGVNLEQARQQVADAWQQFASNIDHDPEDYRLMSRVRAYTWEDMQRAFISAVEKEKVLMLILFGVISVVAIFLILCIFYMIVVEKTRDIGIIKSVGGSAGGVAAVFLSYGAAIGIVGAICGLLLGTVFVHNINGIQDWLASLHPELRVWKADVYSFDTIPNVVKSADAVVIGVIAVLASIVGALVPALIAARKHPVESLRYE